MLQVRIPPISSFLAFVERNGSNWEAVCLDFDLAVQGRSYDEAIAKLRDQVLLFLDGLDDLPPADQERLLRRRVPLHLQLRWLTTAAWSLLRRRPGAGPDEYLVKLPTRLAAA